MATRGHARNLWLREQAAWKPPNDPGDTGEGAADAGKSQPVFLLCRMLLGFFWGGGGREPAAPVRPVLEVADKPRPPPLAAGLALGGRGRFAMPRRDLTSRCRCPVGSRETISAFCSRTKHTNPLVALPSICLLGCAARHQGPVSCEVYSSREAQRSASCPLQGLKCQRAGLVTQSQQNGL